MKKLISISLLIVLLIISKNALSQSVENKSTYNIYRGGASYYNHKNSFRRTACTSLDSVGATAINPYVIDSIPFSVTGFTTAGFGNDYDSVSTPCHNIFSEQEDFIFSITPDSNVLITINLTNTGANPAIFVYDGIPNVISTCCLYHDEDSTGPLSICNVILNGGTQYFIMVDSKFPSLNIPFDFSIDYSSPVSHDSCFQSVNMGIVNSNQSCIHYTGSTSCATSGDSMNLPPPVCFFSSPGNCNYRDIWYSFTSGYTGVTNLFSFTDYYCNIFRLYSGSCNNLTELDCYRIWENYFEPFQVDSGTTYYIQVYHDQDFSYKNCFDYDFCLSSDTLNVSTIRIDKESIDIFPNPSNGIFIIKNQKETASVKVYNFSGIEIKAKQILLPTVDISDQPAGIYILEIKNNKEIFRKTIMKN